MRLKLADCAHERTIPYSLVSDSPQKIIIRATCPSCYQRLIVTVAGRVGVIPDTPAVMCDHPHKKPISEAITKRLPYQDALCTDCGRVLRHPDGPGRWEEVIFYGYVIHEEP